MKAMILLGLNCGFGPKDLRDLTWDDIRDDRVTLPRSKTGVSQTFLLWPETKISLDDIDRVYGGKVPPELQKVTKENQDAMEANRPKNTETPSEVDENL